MVKVAKEAKSGLTMARSSLAPSLCVHCPIFMMTVLRLVKMSARFFPAVSAQGLPHNGWCELRSPRTTT